MKLVKDMRRHDVVLPISPAIRTMGQTQLMNIVYFTIIPVRRPIWRDHWIFVVIR
jgi:hypothetical protein